MDHSEMRRGKPCWHTLPDIGLSGINDALLLDNAIDPTIRRSIPQHPRLNAILQMISETKQKTVIGQMLDCSNIKFEDF